MSRLDLPRPTGRDLIAGASVAMVLVPQSLAYAELAGLPPFLGLFASAFPLLAFCLLASSPYLATGPVALTSLLTFAALPDVEASQLPAVAGLLAVMVGVCRLLLGIGRLGKLVRLMSAPVVMGFTSGAAIVIMATQLPRALDVDPPAGRGTLGRAAWALVNVTEWEPAAVVLTVITVVLFLGGRKLHPLFPGVLVAVIAAIVFSRLSNFDGSIVGEVPEGLPPMTFDLPWSEIPTLLLGALIIALVGFAEPASIARTFANETGERWDADRELVASGVANMVSGFTGGYPIGGSFSRSSVNRLAGAQTRWSGGITGLIVLAFLPFASLLEPLPTAVLGAIVLGAISTLVKPQTLLRLWLFNRTQALLAWATFAATLAFTPRVERAVLLGIALTFAVHVFGRFEMLRSVEPKGSITLRPEGLLWMGTDSVFASTLDQAVEDTTSTVTIDFSATPFLDASTVDAMRSAAERVGARGGSLTWTGAPYGTERMLAAVHNHAAGRPAE